MRADMIPHPALPVCHAGGSGIWDDKASWWPDCAISEIGLPSLLHIGSPVVPSKRNLPRMGPELGRETKLLRKSVQAFTLCSVLRGRDLGFL